MMQDFVAQHLHRNASPQASEDRRKAQAASMNLDGTAAGLVFNQWCTEPPFPLQARLQLNVRTRLSAC